MSCCAPCSAAAIARLKAGGRDFALLFYNPNIFPRAEYDKRLAEQIKLCEKHGVKYAAGDYDHDAWLADIKGLEAEPERGARCAACFRHRARVGIKWALENGYDGVASVFGVSPHKDQSQVDEAFQSALAPYHISRITYRKFDFGYAPERDAYRQKYCGCAPAFAGVTSGGGNGE
ncbi:MAG: epoxyqueuosine reductase QueH [Rickettsiales bacterium]|jgi:predicted adenine nucleotide alpha hydrolase (AANH) superfamily ATPase|nr:epoxyqueuosine reductase QueH [Rickettsiales bacterium]